MEAPFTGEEMRKVVNTMKYEKSAVPDDLEVELIKYASIEIHNEIANIFNTLKKNILGILRRLQKPGKAKGPTIKVETTTPTIYH